MAKAKPTGTSFEDHVAIACEVYEIQGRATFSKVCPPIKVFGGGNAGPKKVVPLPNPFVDFTGAWTERGGRAIHLEAKSTQNPRLPVCRDDGITTEQVEALERWWSAGAAVGLLWHHLGSVRFVTLGMILAVRDGGERVSLAWDKAYPIPEGSGMMSFDFLAVLSQVYPNAAA